MKKIIIPLACGIVTGLALTAIGYQHHQEQLVIYPENAAGFWPAVFWCSVAAFLTALLILFGAPWLWRGFLKCTSDLSKAVRGKD